MDESSGVRVRVCLLWWQFLLLGFLFRCCYCWQHYSLRCWRWWCRHFVRTIVKNSVWYSQTSHSHRFTRVICTSLMSLCAVCKTHHIHLIFFRCADETIRPECFCWQNHTTYQYLASPHRSLSLSKSIEIVHFLQMHYRVM